MLVMPALAIGAPVTQILQRLLVEPFEHAQLLCQEEVSPASLATESVVLPSDKRPSTTIVFQQHPCCHLPLAGPRNINLLWLRSGVKRHRTGTANAWPARLRVD